MGRRRDKHHHLPKFHTLPSSPTHSFSSSSSDFEFTLSLSPRKSSAALCPADELFYKGKILPLHLSPRLSMVRTLLLASSSSSSDTTTTTTTASRDSIGSSTDSHSSFSSDLSQLHPESSRPSSVAEDALEDFKCINSNVSSVDQNPMKKPSKFSLSKFSSVFRKEPKNISSSSTSSQKRTSTSAKEVISKYLRKVKPLYEKISQKHPVKVPSSSSSSITETRMARSANPSLCMKKDGSRSSKERNPVSAHQNKWDHDNHIATVSHSFSGNRRHTRRRSCISSCPSSIRSSPNHSGILRRNGFVPTSTTTASTYSDNSSMEELQSAIQGAIAHCKNSMLQNKTMVSNEGF